MEVCKLFLKWDDSQEKPSKITLKIVKDLKIIREVNAFENFVPEGFLLDF